MKKDRVKKHRVKKTRVKRDRPKARALRDRSGGSTLTAKQVILSPVVAAKAVAKGAGMVGRAITAPVRVALRTKNKRKAKKASKAEALEALRFSRMAPRLQEDVRRTRRRLFD